MTLVFIDTNIFLDFYRLESREAGLTILEKIEQHREILISGDQVAMEFKKNRQKVILDAYRGMKAPDWGSLQLPQILAKTKVSQSLEKKKKAVKAQTDRLRQRLEAVFKDPSRNDPVYRAVERLSRHQGPYILNGKNGIGSEIRELARKRHQLGYPPRKPGDTSIGDAINWEWLIHCANESGGGIVIVTRDSDYGLAVNREPVLNDWLREEFRSRVGRRRKILLTDRLSVAFREASISVTKKEEEAEKELVVESPLARALHVQAQFNKYFAAQKQIRALYHADRLLAPSSILVDTIPEPDDTLPAS